MAFQTIPTPSFLRFAREIVTMFYERKTYTELLMKLSRLYGPIYRINLSSYKAVVLSGHQVVAEACDEKRFQKKIEESLFNLRDVAGDGLFTAHNSESNWALAHGILAPAFSGEAMRNYHGEMLIIANSLLQKWNQATEEVNVTQDMTRLTFDTIGLCGFGVNFESFKSNIPHPFVSTMNSVLTYAQKKTTFPTLVKLKKNAQKNHEKDIESMFKFVDEVIQKRIEDKQALNNDLLGKMLFSSDKKTDQKLDIKNIRFQIITFLVAGHETTSGLLSFAIYFLVNNPEVFQKARREIDDIIANNTQPTFEDIKRLKYLKQVINESMRLWPTAPSFAVEPKEDTIIAEKYHVRKGETLFILLPSLHRDKDWGDDVEVFNPDRFNSDEETPRSSYLFKPFGNGKRSCIGRQFALHEAALVLALVIKNFDFVDSYNYELAIDESLTIKPRDFKIRITKRVV